MSLQERNRKVAKRRGEAWRKAIIVGRHAASQKKSALRSLRIAKAMSQGSVAKKAGLSLATYAAIEMGKRLSKTDRVARIAKAMGSVPTKLFKEASDGKFLVKSV